MKNIKSGFTLIELLVSLGIMSILLVILTEVFGSILTTKLRGQATTALSQDTRYLLSRLSYDISRASSITSSSGDTLTLDIEGVSHHYELVDSTITLTVGGGTPSALNGLGTQVSNLNFTRTDLGIHDSVQIAFEIDSAILIPGNPDISRSITTTIATRE